LIAKDEIPGAATSLSICPVVQDYNGD